MAKLIFGCGYLGVRVAQRWREQGQVVYAVTRSAERAAALASEGLVPLVADAVNDAQLAIPPGVQSVLVAIGNDRRSGRPTTEIYGRAMERVITWMPKTLNRFLYISSTGVSSQTGGAWVDESSLCEPSTEGGRASLAAERLLQQSRFADRALVLRLAGLYGPGRLPKAADIAAGRPIDAAADGWLNLIHVDDAAQIVVAADASAPVPKTYVVSDGQPIVRRDFYTELARLLQAPPPRFIPPAPGSSTAERAASDKRIRPAQLFSDLQITLRYPDYRDGLAAILRQ